MEWLDLAQDRIGTGLFEYGNEFSGSHKIRRNS